MIAEILEKLILEVDASNFVISEFQLGKIPYSLLINECNFVSGIRRDINECNIFMGVPILKHDSNDAILYCLKFKNK